MNKNVEKVVPDSEECVTRCRIMVPSLLLFDVFDGHLGRNHIHNKLASEFYWKGMFADVNKRCVSCHVCQVVGKPNHLIPPYPLQEVPIVGEAFLKSVYRCSRAIVKNAPRQPILINHYTLNYALQNRYFGPYVVHKRVNDTVYAIPTDRKKKRRYCHISLLKGCVDRLPVVPMLPVQIESHPIPCDDPTKEGRKCFI